MAKFNKYSSYKNSDIDYCNQVPSHWNIQKLKLFLAERKKKNLGVPTVAQQDWQHLGSVGTQV